MKRDTVEIEIEVGGQTFLCTVETSPGTPDVMYMPNGDPGYPGDPPEFAVVKVELQLGPHSWIDITDVVTEMGGWYLVTDLAEAAWEPPEFDDFHPEE
ncbi:hypothetical protein UFOVP2_16 [uncultured Caudovirales phage]|uniref:Uncharacterized protein n=1 Tax=uncultured Caudovirales phage TaxID=2100421 RepID=A0A6J5KFW8_9CAUD|nr:hypothetical protein UFOVP2_16 [uncultured Caudovirales phage]